jgi:hypothetical protein
MNQFAWLVVSLVMTTPLLAEETKPAAPVKGPRIVVEPASFNFGEVLQNRTLHKEFTIRNQGSEELVIDKIVSDCGCTVVGFETKDKRIEPGGGATMRVRLNTRSFAGRIVKRVLVRSNDRSRRSYEVKLTATVRKAP